MKLNKFQISAVFFFKSGNSRKVDWIEDRLVKKIEKDNQSINEPLTLDEADAFFQGKFKEWKDKGATIVRKNVKGDASIIPFSEVEYATLNVIQLQEEVQGQPKKEKVKPSEIKDISEHPAFSPIKQ